MPYYINKMNLFNSSVQLNVNITVTNGGFLTDSTIMGVGFDSSSSLIPFISSDYNDYPSIQFDGTLYVGASLQSILTALETFLTGDVFENITLQTVLTIDAVRVY